eukprot:comp23459_c0_seq2/m.39174 comp23459_c0_seq2/g.39174  ORF comp23459_c0_seq2/g.39174 comp23459_c0_seq2/m.39174 type:complete len:590 (-) comp23459_c0_seq2:428-2197(-)
MANKLWTVCIFILIVEMMERLTYYTFSGSQRTHLAKWFPSAQAISINSAFTVMSYVTPILGGWLADARFGRFKTIVGFTVVYCVGVTLASISAFPAIDSQYMYLIGVFAFVAVGSGGIKPNISSFGGDQYDTSNPEELKQQEQFFSYFYMMINAGAAVSFGYLVTLATTGQEPAIPMEYGYFSAYMIAAACMFIALVVFLAGSKRYTRKPPGGDSLRGAIYYIWESAKRNTRGKIALLGWMLATVFLVFSIATAFIAKADAISYVALALVFSAVVCLVYAHSNNSFMDGIPDHPSGFLSLNEAQDFLAIVPTVLVANVCFMIVYNMMAGPFVVQACQMNLQIGSSQLNGAFLNLADCIAIVAFTPVLEQLVFPFIARLKGSHVTRNQKLIAGFLVAAASMVVAAAIEFARKAAPILDITADPNNVSNCAGDPLRNPVPMSDISTFIMFLPFAMVGVAEILINPLMIYFSYDQVPPPRPVPRPGLQRAVLGGAFQRLHVVPHTCAGVVPGQERRPEPGGAGGGVLLRGGGHCAGGHPHGAAGQPQLQREGLHRTGPGHGLRRPRRREKDRRYAPACGCRCNRCRYYVTEE